MAKKSPIMLRGDTWYLRRRVPKRYESVEPKEFAVKSLNTDSRTEAEAKWRGVWDQLVAGWEAKLKGDTSDAEARHAAAMELAAVRGFRYLPAADVVRLPTDSLLARVEAAREVREGAALLGTVPPPMMTVSKALDEYWTLTKDKTLGKSEDQERRWKNPRIKAVRNFTDVIGDKTLDEITRDDLLDFRQWWMERLQEKGLTANSANKDFTHLGDVLKTVNRLKRLGLDLGPILSEMSLKEGEKNTRPPFSNDWITGKLLAPKALAGLNTEARCIVLTMVNTGARPSEIAALRGDSIDLSAKVPVIHIRPDGRAVKSPRGSCSCRPTAPTSTPSKWPSPS